MFFLGIYHLINSLVSVCSDTVWFVMQYCVNFFLLYLLKLSLLVVISFWLSLRSFWNTPIFIIFLVSASSHSGITKDACLIEQSLFFSSGPASLIKKEVFRNQAAVFATEGFHCF